MEDVTSIGTPPWTRSVILEHIDEFASVYADRPIRDNQGGMKAPHMFAVWFMARHLEPDLIVESGVWRGQSTWLLETACPDAKLVSIDVNLGRREYVAEHALYSDKDFAEQDWSDVTDRSLVFFDDHQNAYKRLQQCSWFGFKHVIFDDNYPIKQGDCYSLKKAFANGGFERTRSQRSTRTKDVLSSVLRRGRMFGMDPIHLTPTCDADRVRPNDVDSKMLKRRLAVYHEFPPVLRTSKTRWGDDWDAGSYPTPEPLLQQPTKRTHDIFDVEAQSYTWICYAQLK